MIAEERCLPTTEAVKCHRHMDWHIDADYAHLNLMGEFAGRIAAGAFYSETEGPLRLFRYQRLRQAA